MGSDYPENLKYSSDHEWVDVAGGIAKIGITKFAINQLGEVVMVELPKVGDKFDATEPFGTVESVKAVSELYAPVGGEVVEVNMSLSDDPEALTDDPYGEGWLIKLRVAIPSELDKLLDSDAYQKKIAEDSD